MSDKNILIPLTQGLTATIDAEDADLCGLSDIKPWKWCTNGGRAVRPQKAGGVISLSRWVYYRGEIPPNAASVKFKNGNPLDCRRSNLYCPRATQITDKVVAEILSVDEYKGVFQNKTGRFEIRVRMGDKTVPMEPDYATADEAATTARELASKGVVLV